MLTTTTVSLADKPVTVLTENTSYPSHIRHALIIDLGVTTNGNPDQYLPSFLDHLRSIATEPIDMLQFRGDTPSLEIWTALEGLKHISHLEMVSGYAEYCNIEPLDQVGSAWPLQSIVINSACGEDIKTAHINTITSLTLEYCCGMSFSLATRDNASQLKRLTIIENDACDHFIKLQEETTLINNLTELTIKSTNGCDFAHQYDEECFGKALIQCHSLKSLDLTLNYASEDPSEDHYLAKLPVSFPPNVEVLRFKGPPALANHLSVWHQCALDPTWLPDLQSIEFRLDVRYREEEITVETANLAHERCMQFLADLTSLRPSVTILNKEEVTQHCADK